MQDLTKHLFAFCAAILIAGGSLNVLTTVPAMTDALPLTALTAPELA